MGLCLKAGIASRRFSEKSEIHSSGLQKAKTTLKRNGWVSSLFRARPSLTQGKNSTSEIGFHVGDA
jgi:hypothetical protein